MTENGKRRLKRFAVSASGTVVATTLAGFLLGPIAALIVGVIGFLGTAVASDDDLGTCLPLAVFLLIGLVLLAMTLVITIKINT